MSIEKGEQRGGLRAFLSRMFRPEQRQLVTQEELAALQTEIESIAAVLEPEELNQKVTEYVDMIRGKVSKRAMDEWLKVNVPSQIAQEVVLTGVVSELNRRTTENLILITSWMEEGQESVIFPKIRELLGTIREDQGEGFVEFMSVLTKVKGWLGDAVKLSEEE